MQNRVLQTYDISNGISTTIWKINPEQEFVGNYVNQSGTRRGIAATVGTWE